MPGYHARPSFARVILAVEWLRLWCRRIALCDCSDDFNNILSNLFALSLTLPLA
jgi:hypothetical protein